MTYDLITDDSITNRIRRSLKEDILNSNLYLDYKIITEKEVSEKYGVSKTPSREALNYLCIEGILEKIPYKGYMVKRISFNDIQNLFQFRLILETAAINLAIQNLTEEDILKLENLCLSEESMGPSYKEENFFNINERFHNEIAKMSYNSYLISTLQGVMDQLKLALAIDLKTADVEGLLDEHKQILKYIKLRDTDKAVEAIKNHILDTQDRMYKLIR